MAANLIGYLGYDMVRLVEHLPDVNPDPLGLPDGLMLRPSVVLVVGLIAGGSFFLIQQPQLVTRLAAGSTVMSTRLVSGTLRPSGVK